MIFVLTGNGKGKTTSAIGMGVRAAGAARRVLMVQFLKPPNSSSEVKVIRKIKNFDIRSFGKQGFIVPKRYLKKHPELKKIGVREAEEDDFQLAAKGLDLAKRAIDSKYNILILDESCVALNLGLIEIEGVMPILRKASFSQEIDVVLTGRQCPRKIVRIADLVTEFEEKKHYYKKGVKPRKGIEY